MTFARTLPLGAIILLVAVALVTSPVRAADTEVKIDNFTFNPQQITIKADTTVVKAFAIALAIAVSLGLLIGFALGLHRLSGDAMEPMLVALYSIPKITLYPIILLAFGIGISAKIAFGAIHGIVPVALFTLSAVRTIKPILIKTGRVLKLSPTGMVREILFPAAVPEIFTGIRVGFSLTLIGTVLGEMFAAQRGLGYLLMSAISLYNIDLIMSVTFLLVVLATSVNTVLLAIDRRLHHG